MRKCVPATKLWEIKNEYYNEIDHDKKKQSNKIHDKSYVRVCVSTSITE